MEAKPSSRPSHTRAPYYFQPSDDGGAQAEAEHWLEDYLTEQGAAASKIAKVDAAKAAIQKQTCGAPLIVGVTIESRGFARATLWQLPSQCHR